MEQDLRSVDEATLPPRHTQFQVAFGDGEEWYLEGDRPRRYVAARAQELISTISGGGDRLRMCPFCRVPMRFCGVPAADHELYMVGDSDLIGFGLESCPRCAHWRFWSGNYVCMDPPLYVAATSVAARFSPDLPEGFPDELASALRQHPHRWHTATPTGLERFVAAIFRANYGPCEARHVGGTGDGGVDVLLLTAAGVRTPIQVKRRASAAVHEPVSTIREFLGTLMLQRARNGVVVSTATAFTRPAWNAVHEGRKLGYVVELVDRGALDDLLGPLIPNRPWSDLLSHPELEVAVREVLPRIEEALRPDQLPLPIWAA
jgi:hypothetical protein